MMKDRTARRYLIAGRVQGVGYRAFAAHAARQVNVAGWVRNLADGRVEVHAAGTAGQLDDFEGWLRNGPRFAEVRGFEVTEVTEAAVWDTREFTIR
ncbi:MAG TPA: acylphosphatase [Bryobacteraceae bacterium]|nr:acylphosphatase [Bryobacteraceae bacterium]